MKPQPRYPLIYQINTSVWMDQLGRDLGRPATLDDIPDAALDDIKRNGFHWVWLLTVWTTGPLGRAAALAIKPGLKAVLPDLSDADIRASGFAVADYTVDPTFGGPAALARLRARMAKRELRLMLDFVPNHTGLDHPWATQHPAYYVQGSESDLAAHSGRYTRVGDAILAHGRDPNYDGWRDTLQLNYANAELREAQIGNLLAIADQCDGVRCDMIMLILPEVFKRTWGIDIPDFWPEAIGRLRKRSKNFCVMGECYWGLNQQLLDRGFDYCYDKDPMYERVCRGSARDIRAHLVADLAYQRRMARFLENHDEERAAAVLPLARHQAAAMVTYFTPCLRFFHQGQLKGYRTHIPMQLRRGPEQDPDYGLSPFYRQLLSALSAEVFVDGDWRAIDPLPAWDGNPSHDGFIAYGWQGGGETYLVVVNYAGGEGQCRLRLPFAGLGGKRVALTEMLGDEHYIRSGDEMVGPGLFIGLPAWGYNLFRLSVEG
ncbi:MAG: alpha-amylase [Rhodoferax sp.]|nr:alpha-amylase [Rhodoferax sp.]